MSDVTSAAAEAWNTRYRAAAESEQRLWAAEPHRELQRIVGTLEPSSALDIASGDGRNARWLAARGWSVTAVDFSEAALDLARSHAIGGIEWVHSDVSTWEPGRRFGLITMTYLQLPAEPLKALVARVADWLEPGGTLLVISHDLDNLAAGAPGPRDPAVLHTPELLREAAVGLRVVTAEQYRRDTGADPEHPGESAGEAIDTVLVALREG